MARKAAEKKESSNMNQVEASVKKGTGKKKTAKKRVKKNISKKCQYRKYSLDLNLRKIGGLQKMQGL